MAEKKELRLRNGLKVKLIDKNSCYNGDIGIIESSRQPFESLPTVIDYLIRFPSGNGVHVYAGNIAVLPEQENTTV